MALYFLIIIGSAIGGVARFALSGVIANALGATFPWNTLIINITGSFVIGFINTLTGPDGRMFASGNTRQFLMTGICGGYTTFSSFSLQTLTLMQDGEWGRAVGNVLSSVFCCLLAVWLGHVLALYLNRMRS